MYSPKRTERNDTSLGALTPIVHVLKNAQSNASKDFDRFYDNLWSKLTPSNSRIRKRTPERPVHYRRDDNTGTSLTPLIERHTLREDDVRYDYQDHESEIADTPGLERAETPMSYDSARRSMASPHRSSLSTHQRSMLHSPQRTFLHSPRRSLLHTHQKSTRQQPNSLINDKLAEETMRMDRLQSSITKLKRQSSVLAEEPSFTLEKEDNTSVLNKQHQIRLSLNQLATPPQSIDYNATRHKTPLSSHTLLISKRNRSPSIESPQIKRMAISPTQTKRMTPSTSNDHRVVLPRPITRASVTPIAKKHVAASPPRIAPEDFPKLRSTELISTPGGSIIKNRFWKEIHGLNETRSPSTLRTSHVTESSQTWANDDDFWSAESAPIASAFNQKLFKVAQQEEIQKNKHQEQVENDMHWSVETPVSSKLDVFQLDAFSEKLLNLGSPLSLELESAKKRDEIIKRNNIPTMNPNLLAELKSKHRAKFIDDSDSYKFT